MTANERRALRLREEYLRKKGALGDGTEPIVEDDDISVTEADKELAMELALNPRPSKSKKLRVAEDAAEADHDTGESDG